jgi:methyl-accepting chemotaxis protein
MRFLASPAPRVQTTAARSAAIDADAMSIHNGSTPRRLRPASSQLRLRSVLAFTPMVVALLVALAVAGYRATSDIFRQQAFEQLHSIRVDAANELERHFGRLKAKIIRLASDPNTISALKQLDDGTTQLDSDLLTEPAKMRPQMERLKRFLEHYYQEELSAQSIDLRPLLLPQRSAVWLQAAYIAGNTDPKAGPAQATPSDMTQYARSHAAWDPVFRGMLDRLGVEDLYLINVSGRVVYSARKQPDFQTSFLDGPYAASSPGRLFRDLQKADGVESYRLLDFAPYPPAHEMAAAFAGAPIFEDGRELGVVAVEISSASLTRLVSNDGHWSQIGLGETGDLYLVGSGDADSLMRSESRFGPLAEQARASASKDGTSVLHQRVDSPATSATNHAEDYYQGEYINYRGVSVLGSAGRVSLLNGPEWTLIAEMNSAEALRPVTQLRSRTVWLTAILLVGAVLLIFGLSAVVVAPLRAPSATVTSDVRVEEYRRRLEANLQPVITAAAAVSDGDLSQRIRIEDNLLGDLPRALNRMWRNIGTLVRHVQSASGATIESSTQIQNAAHQLSQEAVQHTTELIDTNALLREAQSRLAALASETAVASDAGHSTEGRARRSIDAVADAIAGMEALQSHTRTLTMRMKRLGERAMEISTVTSTIREITAQANMLALNAAIEASRAGEHGLGFKTVANDVRRLAARTEAAAKDMTDLVTTLHSEAADAVDGVDQQADAIERQTSLIAEACDRLGRSPDTFPHTAGRFSALSVATGEHARAARKLDEAVVRLADFVRRAHVLSEQTVHSSAALLRMLSELKTWSHTFRVRAGTETMKRSPARSGDVIELAPGEIAGGNRRLGA